MFSSPQDSVFMVLVISFLERLLSNASLILSPKTAIGLPKIGQRPFRPPKIGQCSNFDHVSPMKISRSQGTLTNDTAISLFHIKTHAKSIYSDATMWAT